MYKAVANTLFALLVLTNSGLVFAQDENKELVENWDLSQYQGKVVYLDFWASWCVPCRKSFPWMNKIRQQYSEDELVIVAVNLDKKKELAKNFLQEYPANFTVVYDPKGSLAKMYQIKGMPSSIIFDRTGKAVIAHTGFFTKKIETYENELKKEIASQ